ncbi:MAG: FAD-dependent oxidoreductase [Gemmatimonadota bacterium]|nr:FAD-dependent oxidoreductase [Gemmatimonadota bacterium]
MSQQSADFLIIGGGIVGITVALEIKRRQPRAKVTLIEKEEACGLHASGRNSGVLHAGFYYTADSLKARFTREGNERLTAYCTERSLRLRRCGKLVVARDECDLPGLNELLRRACVNGVTLHEVTPQEAREIEPRAKTFERALYSPTTSSVDPGEVLACLIEEARDAGVTILTGTAYLDHRGDRVHTSAGMISSGYVINAAGLYADRIARSYGFSERYEILPFKGLYLKGSSDAAPFRTHIYPVPNLARPFLDVHITLTVAGIAKLGPTAIPAFWREHYSGLRNFSLAESATIVTREAALFLRNDFGFRDHAMVELRKYSRRYLVKEAAELADGLEPRKFRHWGPPGIRAQLFDVQTRKLEMDFRFEGDDRSFHVLNAVSPAFTCSLPFAEFLVDQIEKRCVSGRLAKKTTTPDDRMQMTESS